METINRAEQVFLAIKCECDSFRDGMCLLPFFFVCVVNLPLRAICGFIFVWFSVSAVAGFLNGLITQFIAEAARSFT